MTTESCLNACQDSGYLYAGTEYAGECYCGNAFANGGGPAPDGNAGCNMACNGNNEVWNVFEISKWLLIVLGNLRRARQIERVPIWRFGWANDCPTNDSTDDSTANDRRNFKYTSWTY